MRRRYSRILGGRHLPVDPVPSTRPIRGVTPPRKSNVDIVVCVHNALPDTQSCLESIIRCTTPPYGLILVDDGSDSPTREYLADFATSQGAHLLRNDQARGYTRAANQGLHASTADHVILLNSDTILTPFWLDRLVECAESNPQIGLVGPLSNTASWQSIPEIFDPAGDWAENTLPAGLTHSEMAVCVARYSARLYPRLPFLNGFCLLLKRGLIEQVGIFDEQTFGDGYGEENDLCLRAAKTGWQFAIADDTYIFHAQSRSYSKDRRKQLSEHADRTLIKKHDGQVISKGVFHCRFDRVMQGIRARSRVMCLREMMIEKGKQRWEGRRLAFILPISVPSGGGHVIFQEAEAMQRMGVSVELLNLIGHKSFFDHAYPELEIPTTYVDHPENALSLLPRYDAVVGTLYHTLNWMEAPLGSPVPIRGYYIQDFEPDFFSPGTPQYHDAFTSYARFPDLVRITKTEWNRQVILNKIGVDTRVIGPSVNLDLYRPRPQHGATWPDRPLRIAAMIRPSTPRRQPALTVQVLREITRLHHSSVEVILFGCEPDDPDFHKLTADRENPSTFPWRHCGILTREQLASLLNEVDIFVDFSSFQAMGLTAMEAMACGAAVIVPQEGGANCFARHGENALVVDTSQPETCLTVLDRLVRDEELRHNLQQQAIFDICQYFPENAAYLTLEALFGV